MSGRFVIVQMDNGGDELNLKEVKAFGRPGNFTKKSIFLEWRETCISGVVYGFIFLGVGLWDIKQPIEQTNSDGNWLYFLHMYFLVKYKGKPIQNCWLNSISRVLFFAWRTIGKTIIIFQLIWAESHGDVLVYIKKNENILAISQIWRGEGGSSQCHHCIQFTR